jgi:hypothetical protein
MEINAGMYWSCFCVWREQATLRIYIQWSYFVFSEAMFICANQRTMVFYTHVDEMGMD